MKMKVNHNALQKKNELIKIQLQGNFDFIIINVLFIISF